MFGAPADKGLRGKLRTVIDTDGRESTVQGDEFVQHAPDRADNVLQRRRHDVLDLHGGDVGGDGGERTIAIMQQVGKGVAELLRRLR